MSHTEFLHRSSQGDKSVAVQRHPERCTECQVMAARLRYQWQAIMRDRTLALRQREMACQAFNRPKRGHRD